jgi:hypothetical protein
VSDVILDIIIIQELVRLVWSRLSTGFQIGTNTTNYLSKWNGSFVSSNVLIMGLI